MLHSFVSISPFKSSLDSLIEENVTHTVMNNARLLHKQQELNPHGVLMLYKFPSLQNRRYEEPRTEA